MPDSESIAIERLLSAAAGIVRESGIDAPDGSASHGLAFFWIARIDEIALRRGLQSWAGKNIPFDAVDGNRGYLPEAFQ